jgi:hypothetical protein
VDRSCHRAPRTLHFLMTGVPDDHDRIAALLVPLSLKMNFGDERTGRIDDL